MDFWQDNKEKIDRLLLDETPDIILLVDRKKGLILSAHGNLRNIRRKPEELRGAEMMILRPSKPPSRRVLMFGPSLLDRPGFYGEVLVGTARGRTRTFGIRVQLLEGNSGDQLAVLRMQDMTEQVRMTREMQRMHNELQAAFVDLRDSKSKLDEARRAASLSLFAAGLAHEVNNPLAIAMSSVSSLPSLADDVFKLTGKAQSSRPEELEDIHEAAKEATLAMARIGKMIKRIQQLEIPVNFEQFDMGNFLRTIARPNVKISIQKSADLTLSSDQQALKRVLEVVLENALLASDGQGPVSIKATAEDENLVLTVNDTGCGMSEEVRARACDPFFTTRQPGKGIGLGLFLAKRTMARLDAELSISSEQGRGSSIKLVLPRKPGTEGGAAISYEGFRTG